MIEQPDWIPGCDKYYVESVVRVKGRSDLDALAVTRIYGATPNPNIRNLEVYYPDRVPPGTPTHGNGCGHDRDWNIAVVILSEKGIENNAMAFGQPFLVIAQSVTVHELGHTLKLAHTMRNGKPGYGTENYNEPLRPGEKSIMQPGDQFPILVDIQPYDKRQLEAKW